MTRCGGRAADQGDVVVLPGVFEHYHNITHQTLEILRAASMDPVATHALKARVSMSVQQMAAESLHWPYQALP